MKPQFPFPGTYFLAQGYADNLPSAHYPSGHHGGLDIVPLDHPGGNHWPAPIFPILGGKTLSVANSDVDRGKGIKVRTLLTPAFTAYLVAQNLIPTTYSGSVYLDTLYWHCLMVTDLDGTIDQGVPVAITGNTGYVFAGGVQVPDEQKGRPPYPGLHLHLETILTDGKNPFNLDKDYIGRIDPQIILNYQGDNMGQFKTQNYKGELRIVLQADDQDTWKKLCQVYGADPGHIDETIS